MRARAVALALVALVGAVVVGAAGAPAPAPNAAQETATPTPTPAENDTAMGSEVSSFMGATAGETGAEVDDGMWDAAYEGANGTERRAVVERRADELHERLDALAAERAAVQAAYDNGTISRGEYRARMSRIVGALAALNRSIDTVGERAARTGANGTAVRGLREQASNMSGPEMAAVARGLAGGPPNGTPGVDRRGPPDDGPPRGPPGDSPGGGNDTGGGPPEDSPGGGNDTDGGPPEEGPGGGNDTDGGPPDESGDDSEGGSSGDGGGPPEDSSGGGNESDCGGGGCGNGAVAGVHARPG